MAKPNRNYVKVSYNVSRAAEKWKIGKTKNGIITALRSRANGTKKIFILPTHRVCVGKMGFTRI